MSKKYIHYCWFGGKPLPRLAKKCIKSWEKYLPDYEIIRWSEENVDLNECPFIKEAYENKKWAFVADYARTKAMYEYGGIYFDTDMIVTKNIDFLLNNGTVLGIEDSNMINAAVWIEEEQHSLLSTKLLEFYQKQKEFNPLNVYEYAIPKIITNILDKEGFDNSKLNVIQKLDNNINIYPREYFYPLSYDYKNNVFTENTCMIHYFDASWVPKWEQRETKIIRTFGKEKGQKIINVYKKTKNVLKKILKCILYPFVLYIRKQREIKRVRNELIYFNEKFDLIKNNDYVVIHNPDWLGITSSSKELFDSTLPIKELFNKDEIEEIAKILANSNLRLIIFSGFSKGWESIIEIINNLNPNIKIKILWHGGNAMHIEEYDWNAFKTIFRLLNEKKVKSIGFVKKSMYELYKKKGYNVEFIMNNVNLSKKNINVCENSENNIVKIGLYASGDRWIKNFYNQIAAASLIENAEIDCIPLSNKAIEFSKLLNVELHGSYSLMSRDQILERISKNDINIYTTFVECAPMLPLESLEMGVPCITGNNHHYWENTELEEYLIVNKVDNPIEISNKIKYCLKNKKKIINLYKKWKKDYDEKSKISVNNFINRK